MSDRSDTGGSLQSILIDTPVNQSPAPDITQCPVKSSRLQRIAAWCPGPNVMP